MPKKTILVGRITDKINIICDLLEAIKDNSPELLEISKSLFIITVKYFNEISLKYMNSIILTLDAINQLCRDIFDESQKVFISNLKHEFESSDINHWTKRISEQTMVLVSSYKNQCDENTDF